MRRRSEDQKAKRRITQQRWRADKVADDPWRLRDIRYLAFIRGRPCLVCGLPGDSHHIQYAQPRSLGRKTGDQYAVPVCRVHHVDIHTSGIPERTWWALQGIDPVKWAENTWFKWSKEHGNADDDRRRAANHCKDG